MKDLTEVLRRKADDILDVWVRDVRRDIKSNHAVEMTYEAIRSRVPLIIEAIAARLSLQSPADLGTAEAVVADSALSSRLFIPVKLGFDITELLRELDILRTLLLTALEADFGAEDITDSILSLSKIDEVLSGIVAQATIDHADYQLERVEPMHRELLASNQELIRLVQAQKDNASHLAHELKNPIHAIISFSSILLRKKQKVSEPSQATEIKQIERILDNGKQLSALINNMLEVSRQEHQKLALKIEPVNVAELIDRVVESLESQATEKGLTLTRERTLISGAVHTDSLRLQQIIVNLVSNAIRYTEKGSVVVRCCNVDDDYWALSVRDTGKGISPEQQKDIFDPYVRVGSAATYVPESTGLGLTIVSKLVDLLQGKLELDSELGKGSTFTITLPLDID